MTDGLSDGDEDSDGDGCLDGNEMDDGADPLDADNTTYTGGWPCMGPMDEELVGPGWTPVAAVGGAFGEQSERNWGTRPQLLTNPVIVFGGYAATNRAVGDSLYLFGFRLRQRACQRLL